MAWTSGFFNSVNGDRLYNADQMSGLFEGLITNGVYESIGNKLAVQPSSGMMIQVNTGRGWFGGRWVNNDSPFLQTLENSDVVLNRYCAVCVRVDTTDANRKAELYFKYSNLASNPVKPEMERTETVKEYCLAYVYIKAGATEITAANIEDTRADENLCGWVTGLIKQIDTATLWEQFTGLFNKFMEGKEAAFDAWYNSLVDYIDAEVETKLANDVLTLQNDVSILNRQFIKTFGTFAGLNWNNQGDGTYTQTIPVMGVTPTNTVIVGGAVTHRAEYALMNCHAIEQGENFLTFMCTNPQDIDITVEVIVIDMDDSLRILEQPEDVVATVDSSALFTIVAIGNDLSYEWYYKGTTSTGFSKSSTVGRQYSIIATTARNGFQVYCVIKDAKGNSVTSRVATLTLAT